MLIDRFLPQYQFGERHQIEIVASPDEVYAAVRRLDMSHSLLIRGLFLLRGLPASALSLDGLQSIGFTLLDEVRNRELVLGLAGRFWKFAGDLQTLDTQGFMSFDRAGYAKAAWNFHVSKSTEGRTLLTTETRILCNDAKSLRRFRIYWILIGPFSAAIRRAILRSLKTAAENGCRPR